MAANKQTPPLYKAFFACMKAHGFDESRRRELIGGWTEGRTYSLAGMRAPEIRDLIAHVDRTYTRPMTEAERAEQAKLRKMRSKAMAIATDLELLPRVPMGAKIPHEGWKPFNEWLLANSEPKKALPQCSVAELGRVIDQLEAWQRDKRAKIGSHHSDE